MRFHPVHSQGDSLLEQSERGILIFNYNRLLAMWDGAIFFYWQVFFSSFPIGAYAYITCSV